MWHNKNLCLSQDSEVYAVRKIFAFLRKMVYAVRKSLPVSGRFRCLCSKNNLCLSQEDYEVYRVKKNLRM
jgi:hypothetical protein